MMKMKKFFLRNMVIIVSCFSILLGYFLLQPHMSSCIPFVRELRLSSFLNHTIKNNAISTQEFWQLREFYSPGVIQFIKPNLTFTSDRILSHETLINNNVSLEDLLPRSSHLQHIVYRKKNELIVTSNNDIFVYFIKPISEMIKANAYFDNKDTDEKLLKNKNWYVVTRIKK